VYRQPKQENLTERINKEEGPRQLPVQPEVLDVNPGGQENNKNNVKEHFKNHIESTTRALMSHR
jgi:hypothetical protein